MQTTVNFRLAGNAQPLILIPAIINQQNSYEFILDTGASISIVTPEIAEGLGIKKTGEDEGHGAGGKIKISLGKIDSLAVGTCQIDNLEIGISEELNQIAKVMGVKIDGNIGYDFLQNFRITIDYKQLKLSLSKFELEAFGDEVFQEVNFKIANPEKPLILISALVNGKDNFQFALDTGASNCVISNQLAGIIGLQMSENISMMGAGGGVKASIGTLESLQIGKAELENVSVAIADFFESLSQYVGNQIDGIIGYNFLREFKVMIDYPKEILVLKKN